MEITTRLARRIMREHSFSPNDVERVLGGNEGPVWDIAYATVTLLTPAQLGVICATGEGHDEYAEGVTLYGVHCCDYISSKYWSGLKYMRTIAATAIICRMVNLTRNERRELVHE